MDKTSKVPLYLQLIEEIMEKIESKVYVEGGKLPSERELCEIYGLSRITIRQALRELENDGYIYKSHGVGTFVAAKSYNQQLEKLYSFTEEMKKIGKTPTTKVLLFTIIVADERLIQKMNLQPLEEVYKIVRLRYADEQPLIYETSYVPRKIFPNLTEQDLVERPMYDVFHEDYEIGVTKATERFTATLIRQEEALHLDAILLQPAMLIKRYAHHKDVLIEYTNSVARGDKFAYTVELT